MIHLYINFNNVKNPLLKNKLYKLFIYALKDKLKEINVKKELFFEVNIVYVEKEKIRKLNKEFRKVDKVTDVLSFPLTSFTDEFIHNYNLLGDILICKDVVKEQAKLFGHSFKRELYFIALHGFMHLLGYNHTQADEKSLMMSKTEKFLKKYRVKK